MYTRVSEGRVDAWVLRLLVAASVGLAIAVGILRAVLGQPIHWYLGGGYLLLVLVTYLTPAEITGLAYDAGAVSVNMVTVPLVAAVGVGLAVALGSKNVLLDGFGLVALAFLFPIAAVMLYGILVSLPERDGLRKP